MSEQAEKIVNPEEENSVTMVDVLQDEKDLEDNVRAVLGACDENNCTYNKVSYQNITLFNFFIYILYLILCCKLKQTHINNFHKNVFLYLFTGIHSSSPVCL